MDGTILKKNLFWQLCLYQCPLPTAKVKLDHLQTKQISFIRILVNVVSIL